MNKSKLRLLRLVLLFHAGLAVSIPARAQAPADSLRAGPGSGTAAADGAQISPALADSVQISPAPGDSAQIFPAAVDSVSAPRPLPPAETELDAWARGAGRNLVDPARRAATLRDALRSRPSVQLRETGDPGSHSLLDLTPIGAGAPEFFVDGVPSRNPADFTSSIDDQSHVSLGALRSYDSRWDVGGPFALHGELDVAPEGRTRLRSHFNFTAHETYYRGLAWTTPRAARTLRFDFEEWKTEEGYRSYLGESGPANFGRAKQRRFAFTGQARSQLGLLSVRFGRGRRFHEGELDGGTPISGSLERWTGTVVGGIDRGDSTAHTRLRLYHLDWQDVDYAHAAQSRDAARLGLRAQRSAVERGWSWSVQAERQAASFVDTDSIAWRGDSRYFARGALGHDSGRALRRSARLEIVFDDAAEQRLDVGGSMLLGRGRQGFRYGGGVERRLRLPTLMETSGRWERSFADGLARQLVGGGELNIERQDRAHVEVGGRAGGLDWGVLAEYWRLRRGSAWDIVSDEEARFRGDAELDLPVARIHARRAVGTPRLGLAAEARASRLLDAPEVDGSRGTGWPRSWVGATLSAWTRFFHDRNRLTLRYALGSSGERIDDRTAPLSSDASRAVLPWETRHDLRLTLRILDAELYLLWENVSDALLQDMSASRLRGRQRVWGLFWNFYN